MLRAARRSAMAVAVAVTVLVQLATAIAASSNQVAFESSTPSADFDGIIQLSHEGLHVNSPAKPPPRYLTLSTVSTADLDPTSAFLHLSPSKRRSWQDVTTGCGSLAGLEGCEEKDMQQSESGRDSTCRPAHATVDGRILFDPYSEGCEPLGEVWKQWQSAWEASGSSTTKVAESLLSIKIGVSMQRNQRAELAEPLRRDFWLAHLWRDRARWPISDDAGKTQDDAWTGLQPNRVSRLMEDPYLPRTAKPENNDDFNGVDVTYARWNLGVSLRLPPQPSGNSNISALIPVHAPVGGQVVRVELYRRPEAPSSVNDEQGWVISIRDEWGFVWSLLGISPYHQKVYAGQNIPQGHVLGRVSLRPLEANEPRDQDPPADPPKKTPGDDNELYPYRYRELRIDVSRPYRGWQEWKDPYATGWTRYNPLAFLPFDDGDKKSDLVPPYPDPYEIFFARPVAYAPNPPEIVASTTLLASSSREGPASSLSQKDDCAVSSLEFPVLPQVTLSGDVEIIMGIRSFAQAQSQQRPSISASALDPTGIYSLEWAFVPADFTSSAEMLHIPDWAWRPSIEHSRIPHAWPPSPRSKPPDPNRSSELWRYFVPAFSTRGLFPWSRKKYASQFDGKARYLFYPLTRVLPSTSAPVASRGNTDHSSAVTAGTMGSWNTRLEASHPNPHPSPGAPDRGRGRGDFILVVRAWDQWKRSDVRHSRGEGGKGEWTAGDSLSSSSGATCLAKVRVILDN